MKDEQTENHATFEAWWKKNSDRLGIHSSVRALAWDVWSSSAAEVLKRLPGEWVLVTEGLIKEGDELLNPNVGWHAAQSIWFHSKTTQVLACRRRLSPVPEQQPQLGSP